ncbi:MAG: DRTGG domain-containing protein [Syntrophorhabdaceae bacterium]|nr:DRTGG domain-containing protein [Syntrophorhabdaceae bacterium]
MKLLDVKNILNAKVLFGEHLLNTEVKRVFASDLISEMLINVTPGTLLITSLTNAHVIHTAQVMDASGVVFVGGKTPDQEVIKNGSMSNIPLFSTEYLIFDCCGLLFQSGLKGNKKDKH